MRVNIYAEEMTDRIEIISKIIDGQVFTGVRFYLELPVTVKELVKNENRNFLNPGESVVVNKQISGPFIHREGDDDSSAVTFWGKRDLREVLKIALNMLDMHYSDKSEIRLYE